MSDLIERAREAYRWQRNDAGLVTLPERIFNEMIERIKELESEEPGTPLGRLAGLARFAIDNGLCKGIEAQPPEIFLIERIKELEARLASPLPEEIAGIVTGLKLAADYAGEEYETLLDHAAAALEQQAREIERLKAERDRWKAASGSGKLSDLSQGVVAERDAIEAAMIEECIQARVTFRAFGTASDEFLEGFQAGVNAKDEAIRALKAPQTET
jgi:hypothetical protein